jgi:hypothetical protein
MLNNLLPKFVLVVMLLALTTSGILAVDPVIADKDTGSISVETNRYKARFEMGLLVYLQNKLKNRVMIDNSLDANIPTGFRTALYVADKPKTEPYWIYPVSDGDKKSVVTIKESDRNSVTVSFKGLAAQQGTTRQFYDDAELIVTVAVDTKSGDILVKTSGTSPSKLVIGSSFAYSGLMTQSYNYTTVSSGLKQYIDLKTNKRSTSILEWSNLNHGKRMGLKGGLWPAAVTVQASVSDPAASFAVWADDDVPRSKYLIESGKGNAYATYEMPPFDNNHQADSVTWHVNVFDGGWTAAATPFAESLKRRGMVDARASWRNDISLIIFANGPGTTWLNSYKAAFPPEVRKRILIWLPQSWRTLSNTRDAITQDAYYWDNNFSDQTKADINKAIEAGFRVSGYTNPHYNWGSWKQVIDPEIAEIVKGYAALPSTCPVSQEPVQHTGNTLAYTPYREHMLRTYKHIFDNMDMSIYMDTMHQTLLDGRGRAVDGMSSYEGVLKFFRAARALKKEQFIGIENLTELAVMGGCADHGLLFDLEWSKGWEKYKATNTHPIVGYLFRDTSLQISQRVNTGAAGGARYYHLAEEISERIGTIATTEWPFQNDSPANKLDTPERKHWYSKIQLYSNRGLRPFFPIKWEEGVMSYLKAADGTVFVYEETDYGSRLVERTLKGKIIHSARAWKNNTLKTTDGDVVGWIGRADDGTWIGLDSDNGGYVLMPNVDADKRLRVRSLPVGICLKNITVTDNIVTLTLAKLSSDEGKKYAGDTVPVGFTSAKPVLRIASANNSQITINDGNAANLPLDTPLAFILTKGVIAPFESSSQFSIPMSAEQSINGGKGEIFQQLGSWDQKWNASATGAVNPRPGTVYSLSFDAARADKKSSTLTCFMTSGGTRSSGFFRESGAVALTNDELQRFTIAGVRSLSMAWAWDKTLGIRMYGGGDVKNLSPVEFIRPELSVSDITAIDLGVVKPGQVSDFSLKRKISNSQKSVAKIGDVTWCSVLYGAANITAPADKPYLQVNDNVGIMIKGTDAGSFEFDKGVHMVKLTGADGNPGLEGGENPEFEDFAVRFIGNDKPGMYKAIIRIITQAVNKGTCSAGKENEPLINLYYIDIQVKVEVKP